MFRTLILSFTFLFLFFQINAQQATFKVVPLGVKGGSDESNLSCYMVAPAQSDEYVCLDGGTVYSGIKKAIEKGSFSKSTDRVLKENIKGYLISHGHLDHNAGMIITSPEDTVKQVYALPSVQKVLEEKYFTWSSWANFADAGEPPFLKKFQYITLEAGQETSLTHTQMAATPFSLSHVHPYESTAFLIRHEDSYLLYFGDTGPDEVEKSDKLRQVWQSVASLIVSKKLKAIFIEVSYPNEQPDVSLFGHLTPKWLMHEMDVLSSFTGQPALKGFPVVVTHIKPSPVKERQIKTQLAAANTLQLQIIIPEQGERLEF